MQDKRAETEPEQIKGQFADVRFEAFRLSGGQWYLKIKCVREVIELELPDDETMGAVMALMVAGGFENEEVDSWLSELAEPVFKGVPLECRLIP